MGDLNWMQKATEKVANQISDLDYGIINEDMYSHKSGCRN